MYVTILKNRRSKDKKMSRTIWEVMEAKAGEVRTAETEGRRRKRKRNKKIKNRKGEIKKT